MFSEHTTFILIFFLNLLSIIFVLPLIDNQSNKYALLDVVPEIPKISNFEFIALILLIAKAN